MDYLHRLVQWQKLSTVDFPARAMRARICRGWCGKSMDALAAFGVFNVTQRNQLALNTDTVFFPRFAHSRRLEPLSVVRLPLGNAPRRLAVVIARRMHQQHFNLLAATPICQDAGRFDHGHSFPNRPETFNKLWCCRGSTCAEE